MKRRRQIQAILNLAFACLLVLEILPAPQPAEAGLNPFNAVMGFIRVINGVNRRNRIYRAARDAKKDFDAYYGSLQDTARQQLLEGDLSSLRQGKDGLDRSRAAAYIRMAAALQAEQAAIQRAVDAETNAARREFNRILAQQLQSLILQLPGAQRILGDVRSTIANIRRTAIAIQAATTAGQPVDRLAEELAQQVQYSVELQQLVRNLGSAAGSELDRKLGGALNQVDQALSDIKNQANQTVQLLDSMDAEVGQWDLSQAELGTGEEEIGPVDALLTDRATAVLDVASQALAFLSAAQGTGGITRQQLYQQIRADLLNQRNANLLNAALQVNSVVCAQVDQKAYLAAAASLGEAPRTPSDSATASYYVCTNQETGEAVGAWVGRVDTETPEPDDATVEPTPGDSGEATGTPQGRWTLEQADAAPFLSFTTEVVNDNDDGVNDVCHADLSVTNTNPTYSMVMDCERYLFPEVDVPRVVRYSFLGGQTIEFAQSVRQSFRGNLSQQEYIVQCAGYLSDAGILRNPGTDWLDETYGEVGSLLTSGLTIVVPPNPCGP